MASIPESQKKEHDFERPPTQPKMYLNTFKGQRDLINVVKQDHDSMLKVAQRWP